MIHIGIGYYMSKIKQRVAGFALAGTAMVGTAFVAAGPAHADDYGQYIGTYQYIGQCQYEGAEYVHYDGADYYNCYLSIDGYNLYVYYPVA
jgi:hypothetical protein